MCKRELCVTGVTVDLVVSNYTETILQKYLTHID